MKKHWTLAAVIVGVALVWLMLTWGSPQEERSAPEPASPTALEQAGQGAPPVEAAPSPTTPEPAPAPSAPSADPAAKETPARTLNEPPRIPTPERSGPVDEMKQAFASEARASSAVGIESQIAVQFKRPEVRPELVKSILCRTSVCRIETRWSPERAEGFMSALMHLVTDPADQGRFDSNLGISPQGEPSADGSAAIDVYLRHTSADQNQH